MVDSKTADTKAPVEPRPALAADDPRAIHYREEYEQRMAGAGTAGDQNAEQRAAAKEAFDKAKAQHDTAQENYNKASEELAAAKLELQRASDAYARLGDPALVPLTPAEILSPGEETVLMVFPKAVTLQANTKREDGTITGNRSATFPKGIQEVPVSLQNHPYLIAHNVLPYGGPRVAPKAPEKVKEAKAA